MLLLGEVKRFDMDAPRYIPEMKQKTRFQAQLAGAHCASTNIYRHSSSTTRVRQLDTVLPAAVIPMAANIPAAAESICVACLRNINATTFPSIHGLRWDAEVAVRFWCGHWCGPFWVRSSLVPWCGPPWCRGVVRLVRSSFGVVLIWDGEYADKIKRGNWEREKKVIGEVLDVSVDHTGVRHEVAGHLSLDCRRTKTCFAGVPTASAPGEHKES